MALYIWSLEPGESKKRAGLLFDHEANQTSILLAPVLYRRLTLLGIHSCSLPWPPRSLLRHGWLSGVIASSK